MDIDLMEYGGTLGVDKSHNTKLEGVSIYPPLLPKTVLNYR
jgi:hypothetical protein